MNSFRIIALRVLGGCEPHIRRALKENVTYFLCNDYLDYYTEHGVWDRIDKKENEDSKLPDSFFSLPKREGQPKVKRIPTVSISAIVGKNGDGKSSLVELMLRIINNFSVAYGFRDNQESLAQIQGVEAVLYYEIDGKLYNIRCSHGNTEASFAKRGGKETLKQHQNALFYSIVANYSIYAYNSRNFEREVEKGDECWINGVFHKNDNYQTPMVLNPMRTEGNFDVNREEDLCRQRLLALYADMGDDLNARVINGEKIATGYAYNLEKKSKFETDTLHHYFKNTWNSTDLKVIAEDLEGDINHEKTSKSPVGKDSVRSRHKEEMQFWIRYAEYWNKYRPLFEFAEQVTRQIYIDNNANYYEVSDTDLKRYLKSTKQFIEVFVEKKKEKEILRQSLNTVDESTLKLTGLQFQRLVLIIDVCELWSKQPWFSKDDFLTDIKHYINQKNKGCDEKCHARLYIIYKTISIFSQYKRFQNLLDANPRSFYLFDGRYEDGSEYHNSLSQCFDLLFTDKERQQIQMTYDTLKLRQTINYLLYHNSYNNWQTDRIFGFSNYVTFESLHGFIQKTKKQCREETIALLPPPIFEGEILVSEGDYRFKMSDLSSGELQMLNSISTYIYHLRNLNYHLDVEDSVEYSYVNLILEEVELYFHPEYQRQYVYQMLRQIRQVKLDNIKAINIILVTHSPFVLTDIPKNNVLFLQDGEPVHVMQENTFGANIHALLQNGFFLKGSPMGEFAKEKINNMFERLHKGDYSEELFEEIKLVSEPLLKTQLYKLFGLNKSINSIQYKRLEERIEQLEEKLNGGHKNT